MNNHISHPSGLLDALIRQCRASGLALTPQRRVVLEVLCLNLDHPTADQVLNEAKKRLPEVSRSSVYRILETLVQHGITTQAFHDGKAVRYDPVIRRHHHLHCRACGKLIDLHSSSLDTLPIPDPVAEGFEIHDFTVHFRGLCASCRGRNPANANDNPHKKGDSP